MPSAGSSSADSNAVRIAVSLRIPSIEAAAIWALATFAIIIALAVFLVGYDALADNLKKLDMTTLALSAALMVWQVGFRFVRWAWYAWWLGLRIPLPEAALYYAAGLGMTLTPGRLGELVRLWFLEKRFAVPYRRLIGLYIADRVSDVTAYLILFAIGSTAYRHGLSIAWGGIAIIVLMIAVLMNPRPIFLLLNACHAAIGRGRKLVLWLRRAFRNTALLFRPRVLLPGLAFGTIGWLAPAWVLVMTLSQMGVALHPLQAIAIYSAAALVGGATMLPGGGGGTEAVLVSLLVSSNVPLDSAVAATIVTRIAFLWLPVALGIVALPVAMRTVRAAAR
jgi:uncharacterized protein (TIRG00374 family)